MNTHVASRHAQVVDDDDDMDIGAIRAAHEALEAQCTFSLSLTPAEAQRVLADRKSASALGAKSILSPLASLPVCEEPDGINTTTTVLTPQLLFHLSQRMHEWTCPADDSATEMLARQTSDRSPFVQIDLSVANLLGEDVNWGSRIHHRFDGVVAAGHQDDFSLIFDSRTLARLNSASRASLAHPYRILSNLAMCLTIFSVRVSYFHVARSHARTPHQSPRQPNVAGECYYYGSTMPKPQPLPRMYTPAPACAATTTAAATAAAAPAAAPAVAPTLALTLVRTFTPAQTNAAKA